MLTEIQIYDHMLRLQADMAFPIERGLFQHKGWKSSHVVLDFGSGNSHYTSLLKSMYPEKEYYSLEKDSEMAALAEERHGKTINVFSGGIETLPNDFKFDALIVRLVSLHLPDREVLYEMAAKHANAGAIVIVIDADDEYFMYDPDMPIFRQALEHLREKKAVERNLRGIIDNEWSKHGFVKQFEHRYLINSDFPGNRERMFMYMKRTAELSLGTPLAAELDEEFSDWFWNPKAYVQYGVFGVVFEFNTES